jgi:hypothetical protein
MAVAKFTAALMNGQPINITCFKPPPAAAAAIGDHIMQQQQSPLLQGHAERHAAGLALPGPTATSVTVSLQDTSRRQLSLQDTSRRQLSLQETRLTTLAGCVPAVRDFTAVSDVVRGILAACKITASNASNAHLDDTDLKHMVYNLGRGQPASTVNLLRHLEALLHKQAVAVNFLMPPAAAAAASSGAGTADVWATWADMSAAKQGLKFEPRVGLKEGLREYVAWYKREMCSEKGDCADVLA